MFSAEKDFIVNADTISYDKEKSIVEAQGSVEVLYKDLVAHGEHMLYYKKEEQLLLDHGFDLRYEGITLEGQKLFYRINEKDGTAEGVTFHYRNVALEGNKVEFNRERFALKNASFSTCNLLPPHYHVTAGDIMLYPKYDWLVAYWGFFWYDKFPLVPVPTYIYDLSPEEADQAKQLPFPEIGSNDEDGVYIKESLAWHVRRELSGTYSLSYAAKKSFGLGGQANYIVNENNRGNFRLAGNFVDGLFGGITHRLFFGVKEAEERGQGDAFSPFVNTPRQPQQFELETILSSRERINYQKVSFYPSLTLKLKRSKLFAESLKYEGEVMVGWVGEEKNVDLGRLGGKLGLYWTLPELLLGTLIPSLKVDARTYSSGQNWETTIGRLDLKKKLTENIFLDLGAEQYFSVVGQSPFNFEMYRFSPLPRIAGDLLFRIGETGVNLHASYFTNNWWPEDLDYALFFRMHCYNLIMKYRSLRREFEMGVSLLGE